MVLGATWGPGKRWIMKLEYIMAGYSTLCRRCPAMSIPGFMNEVPHSNPTGGKVWS